MQAVELIYPIRRRKGSDNQLLIVGVDYSCKFQNKSWICDCLWDCLDLHFYQGSTPEWIIQSRSKTYVENKEIVDDYHFLKSILESPLIWLFASVSIILIVCILFIDALSLSHKLNSEQFRHLHCFHINSLCLVGTNVVN